jgi:hypothetical protein
VDEAPSCRPPAFAGGPLLSSVSHANLIHASCHAAAKAADLNLRQPKREWDGATIRNGEVGPGLGCGVWGLGELAAGRGGRAGC